MKKIFISKNVNDTINFGEMLGKCLLPNAIVILEGDLGAGKTHFTKGIAKALGIDDMITSPTFTILNVYNGRINLYHYDMYRLSNEDEIFELGLDDYFSNGGICVIEWNIYKRFNVEPVIVKIENNGNDLRTITVIGNEDIIKRLEQ